MGYLDVEEVLDLHAEDVMIQLFQLTMKFSSIPLKERKLGFLIRSLHCKLSAVLSPSTSCKVINANGTRAEASRSLSCELFEALKSGVQGGSGHSTPTHIHTVTQPRELSWLSD